jgi:hypothetical protein
LTAQTSRYQREESSDESVRDALIGQLRYLCDELRMLSPMASALPRGLLEARRTEGSSSLLEIYAMLLVATSVDARRALEKGVLSQSPDSAEVSTASEAEISDILGRLISERERLASELERLPASAWSADGIGLRIATHLTDLDLRLQQSAAELLAEWSPARPG